MLVRLLGNLFINPLNIPLRRSAFATRRCPPSKGELLVHDYPIKYRSASATTTSRGVLGVASSAAQTGFKDTL